MSRPGAPKIGDTCPWVCCSECTAPMIVRARRQSNNAMFLGCSEFPRCRHTLSMHDAQYRALGPELDGGPAVATALRTLEIILWFLGLCDPEDYDAMLTGLSALLYRHMPPPTLVEARPNIQGVIHLDDVDII